MNMTGETDTDLMRRYLAVEEAEKSGPLSNQMKHERETIIVLWREVLGRKRAGKATDLANVEAAKLAITKIAREHFFPNVRLFGDVIDEHWEREEPPRSVMISLVVMYGGNRTAFGIKRWEGMIEAAGVELAGFDFVGNARRPDHYWGYDPSEVPKDYEQRDYGLPGHPFYVTADDEEHETADDEGAGETFDAFDPLAIPADPFQRRCAEWVINTHVWDGPHRDPDIRRRRQ